MKPEYTFTITDSGSLKVQCRGDSNVDDYCRDLNAFLKAQKLNVLFWPTVYFSTPETKSNGFGKKNKTSSAYAKKKPVKHMSQKQVDKICAEFENKGATKQPSTVITDDDLPWVL